MEIEKESEIKESAQFYLDKKMKVHIVLINKFNPGSSGRFYNGVIVEVKEKILIVDEVKLGIVAVPIREIYLLERFNELNGIGNGKTGV